MTAAHTKCGLPWAHDRNQRAHIRSIIVTTPIASPPASTVPIVAITPAVALSAEPSRVHTIEQSPTSWSIAGRLEDLVLLIGAVFLFPVIILLAGSPFALLAKAVVAGVKRLL
jgi:hypothetical protein